MKKPMFALIFLAIILAACSPQAAGPSPEQLASTMVAQTAAAKPTDTSMPPATSTPLPAPTDTNTPLPPTETPTQEPTPGPVVFKDDFSAQTDAWGKCENCEWRDGALFFGPFPAKAQGNDNLFYMQCETCGEHKFFRAAVDVTFADGQAGDRTYGLLLGVTAEKFLYAVGISPYQYCLFETFDFQTQQWNDAKFQKFTAVKPGKATNHIEVLVKPSSNGTSADYTISVNGKTLIQVFEQPIRLGKPGMYLGWHSVGAMYDNFEYEEIVP
jgi:hypothetical protein